jgi:hypothetical protein
MERMVGTHDSIQVLEIVFFGNFRTIGSERADGWADRLRSASRRSFSTIS